MRTGDLAETGWRTSSRSGGGGDQTNCVEVAELADQVALRDSKNPAGPVLVFGRAEWHGFVVRVRTSQFDRNQ
ncbi:MAG TPA: DUF397 domain-containing protein [Pseudonocardiaceae bacterium]|nr:DUF397 domain-containing protein [Pseudonocardiaceae bacterium]